VSTTPSLTGDILIVDDERSMREFLGIYLRRAGHRVEAADGGVKGNAILQTQTFDVVITDLKMPGEVGGLDVLAEAKRVSPDTQVIVVTAFATAETAIAAMKAGAYDYLTKPFKVDEVGLVVERALERRQLKKHNVVLRDEIKGRYKLDRLIGKAPPMQRMFEMVRKIAPARTSVLLIGESGTGKELAARALHELSPRAAHPFVAINCGAIPETLLESELFGHVKGSFTGANTDKPGLFEAAHGGTLLLDEVGELPVSMQVKLLRVLQERKVKRVGGLAEVEIDVRVVAATNRDLEAEVEKGTFRQDLYYRLNVIQVRVPSLRERKDDIPYLVDHFIRRFSAEHGRTISGIDPDTLSALVAHNFPGNVRELENIIERAVTLAPGDRLSRDTLPPLTATSATNHTAISLPEEGLDLEKVVEDFERAILLKALERTDGNRTEAARLLGVTFRSLRYRLSKLGISGSESEPTEGEVEPARNERTP
jgi:two-component system response regulator PilR (NtrC family)